MKYTIKKMIKTILIFILNFYFHSDEKSLSFLRARLKNKFWASVLTDRELETIISISIQDNYDLSRAYDAKKLVVFFEIAPYRMCGGQMSLFSYCKYSKEILATDAEVIMTTLPGLYTYNHNTNFENDIKICRWEQIVDLLVNKEECVLHIPEVNIVNPENGEELFKNSLSDIDLKLLQSINKLHINIVNQQIEIMPPVDKFQWLHEITDKLTMTVCNKAAATQKICDKFGLPLHMLSVYYDLGNVKRIPVPKKTKLILLSPDVPPDGLQSKTNFVKKINKELPDYKIFFIHNLTLQECMTLTAAAAAVISFGEGFDGYLNNSPQVGTMAFAVYNDTFFPDESWKNFPNVYLSYEEMYANVITDIKKYMNNANLYEETVAKHEKAVHDLYNFNAYLDNLKRFYEERFDFYPAKKLEKNKNDH